MGCTTVPDEFDDMMLAKSARGENNTLAERLLEEMSPEIEKAVEQRTIECLKENTAKAKEELRESLAQGSREPTDIERLDLGVEPTQEEYREMFKVGKELGMTRDLEIIDLPAITAIKDPEEVITQEEIQSKVQAAEIKLEEIDEVINQIEQRVQENHIDIETTKALMRETLSFLQKSKMPYEWRDQATVNMIVFVDKQEPGTRPGYIAVERAVKPEELQKSDRRTLERSRNLYLFQNKEGRLLPKTEEERKDLHWKIAHGICHINDPRFKDGRAGRFDTKIAENPAEWIKACEAQLKMGVVDTELDERQPHSLSDVSLEDRNNPEEVQDSREFRAQHFAAWETDSPKLCPEMKKFFDKYLGE